MFARCQRPLRGTLTSLCSQRMRSARPVAEDSNLVYRREILAKITDSLHRQTKITLAIATKTENVAFVNAHSASFYRPQTKTQDDT